MNIITQDVLRMDYGLYSDEPPEAMHNAEHPFALYVFSAEGCGTGREGGKNKMFRGHN